MQERTCRHPKPGHLDLWLWWTLANGAGGAIVGALEADGFQFFATLVLSGPILSIAQWLVLWQYLRAAGAWILLSTGGWLLGTTLRVLLLKRGLDLIVQNLLAVGGWEVFWLNTVNQSVTLAVFGAAQWLILRRYFRAAGWWILASAAAGGVNGAASSTTCAVACQAVAASLANGQLGAMAATALSSGLGWAGYGAVTGMILVRLLPGSQDRNSTAGRTL